LTRAAYVKVSTVQARIKRHAVRCCLSVVASALAMVMAGSGEINVLRRLRVAHGHFSEGVTYGTHLASHMALGMLFVGGGYYTLGTSDAAVAALLMAFYPTLPNTAGENRAHLQALRHLWVLAIEPRCVEARDVDTGERTFLPFRLKLKDDLASRDQQLRARQMVTPTHIPDLDVVEAIQADSPRYWTFSLQLGGRDPAQRARFVREQVIWVKRRTGHLSYAEDPRGIRSIFTRSKSEAGSAVVDWGEGGRMLSPTAAGLADFVAAFEDAGRAHAAVEWLCFASAAVVADGRADPRASAFEAFCSAVLLECLTRDKPDTVPVYLELFRTRALAGRRRVADEAVLALEQAAMVAAFYDRANGGGYELLFGAAKARLKASASRERLVQKTLVAHLGATLTALAEQESDGGAYADGRGGLAGAVRAYLGRGEWPIRAEEAARLARWLRVHRAPDLAGLEALRAAVEGQKAAAGEGALEWFVRRLGRAVGEDMGGTRVWSSEFGRALAASV